MQTKACSRVIVAQGSAFMQRVVPIHPPRLLLLKLGIIAAFALALFARSALADWTAKDDKNWGAIQAAIKVFNSGKVTTNDIVHLLEMKGEFTDSSAILQNIAVRAYENPHLTFSMTGADVARLKHAGATPELIAAMRSPSSVAHPPDRLTLNQPTRVANSAANVANPAAASSGGASNVELIIDASGSMAAKIQGRTKMDIAKQALTELLLSIPSSTNVAVRAYGHHRKDDCSDIELIANFGEARSGIPAKVNNLKPLGKTPLSASIAASAADFVGKEGQQNTVVLITDGEETCNADPCAAAKTAHESGIQVKINVIGFKIDPKERAQLECIANAGGGKYVSANDAKELTAATQQVALAAPPEPAPAATANPASDNILATTNGGQLLVAPSDGWSAANDGKEEYAEVKPGQEAVFAFKDEEPATFDNFAMLIPEASDRNPKEFELLVGDESPTGTFRSIGTFTAQNAKLLKSPYQPFKFDPVTAKYLKVKLTSNYGAYNRLGIYEFKIKGQTNVKGQESGAKTAEKKSDAPNILATANGGQLLVAPNDSWNAANDGKEDYAEVKPGEEAVFAFKDENPATFDRFAVLVNEASDRNLKEFELLAGDESPTGTFRSIGTFTVQNAKMLKSPYQEFKFEPVTAKYLKVKLTSNYGAYNRLGIYEFRLFGQIGTGGSGAGSSAGQTTSSESKAAGTSAKTGDSNILAQSAGGQILVAPNDEWTKTNDGKEEYGEVKPGQEGVFAFKDEKPMTFDKFSTLVSETSDRNLKEFELLVGDESPTGTFRSIGTFTVQNAKMLKSPYQEFKFEPVTAKYLKIKLISNYGAYNRLGFYEFKLSGSPAQ